MNELQVFNNIDFGEVRVLELEGEPWFVGKDVAEALGYERTNSMKKLLESEDCIEIDPQSGFSAGLLQNGVTLESNPNIRRMLLISESGLYQAIFNSTLEKAKQFKLWVTSEVLPTIRKHGLYAIDDILENPDIAIAALTKLKEERAKRKALEAQNAVMQPKADYFDELVDRNTLTNFRDTAKLLGIKQKKFIQFLIDNEYVFRDRKNNLKPYASEKCTGLFEIKECLNERNAWSGVQTLITPKGVETFRLLCRKGEKDYEII